MAPMAACVKAGIPFSLHTDSPVSPAGPLRLVQIAVTRRCVIDNSVIGADQAISVDEALKAITVHAARQIGLEDSIGTLEPGKEADLTILESDPTRRAPSDLGHQGQRDLGGRPEEIRLSAALTLLPAAAEREIELHEREPFVQAGLVDVTSA